MSSSGSSQRIFCIVQDFIRTRPFSSAAVGILSVMVFKRINKDYHEWLELGPGGAPYNFAGYVLSYALGAAASNDVKSSFCYESLGDSKGYLENIPIREGTAPEISKWLVPVRQLTGRADESRIHALEDMMNELALEHETIFAAPSLLEGGHSVALFIKSKGAKGSEKTRTARGREIFHCHDTEGSAHVILAPADARLMLDLGWGQRHPLSGRMMNLPLNYVMIYAPRNDAEMAIMKNVAQAAIQYAFERRRNGTL